MNSSQDSSQFKDKKLFTPGPLSVSSRVRQALTRDFGSRDTEFIAAVKFLREKLVEIAGFSLEEYTGILMQGSGTFAIESVLNSTSDRSKKVLILISGAYGKRMQLICEKASIPHESLQFSENEIVDVDKVLSVMKERGEGFCSVAIVHCETTSGIINPIAKIGKVIKEYNPNINYFVDAMSSFGGVQENFETVDFLVSSANKCLSGVPGFGFVIAKISKLQQCKGKSTSLSLDLFDQYQNFETTGQFRFTPATHTICALVEAIKELEEEGGVSARTKRYQENNTLLKKGMDKMGFERFVKDDNDGHIITSFRYPNHANFKFEDFYNGLSNKGLLIYPGKVTKEDCFRIGNIGNIFPEDITHLLFSIEQVLKDMKIPTPLN